MKKAPPQPRRAQPLPPEKIGLLVSQGSQVIARIRKSAGNMTAAERRVADFILYHPEEAAGMSMMEIARQAKSSDATVLRFVRTAGFEGFKTFKIALAAELFYPKEAIFETIRPLDNPTTLIQKTAAANMLVIKETAAALNPGALRKTIALIRRAKKIFICAVGTSIPMAFWLYDRLFRLGFPAVLLTDSHYFYTQAAIAGNRDAFFFVSRSGCPAELVKLIKIIAADSRGIQKILITCDAGSPLAAHADFILAGVSRETYPEIAGSC
ncbi:MAG: MurR/RpiR family transcriptional regulator, partial [Spirochaetales bacterium]|nr:MurR/RpiR family transcriptional regulator [Spirochaetales bacterium]